MTIQMLTIDNVIFFTFLVPLLAGYSGVLALAIAAKTTDPICQTNVKYCKVN